MVKGLRQATNEHAPPPEGVGEKQIPLFCVYEWCDNGAEEVYPHIKSNNGTPYRIPRTTTYKYSIVPGTGLVCYVVVHCMVVWFTGIPYLHVLVVQRSLTVLRLNQAGHDVTRVLYGAVFPTGSMRLTAPHRTTPHHTLGFTISENRTEPDRRILCPSFAKLFNSTHNQKPKPTKPRLIDTI